MSYLTKEKEETSWGVVLFVLVWSILNTFIRGYVIQCYWEWFIASQFPIDYLLTLKQAIAVSFFVSLFTTKIEVDRKTKSSKDRVVEVITITFVYGIVLVLSYLFYKLYFV